MGRKPDRLTKSINFGNKGDLARSIVERLEKQVGKQKLSEEIRKAVITHFSNSKEFQQAKINGLLEERKQLQKKIPEISEQLQKNEETLNKLGYNLGKDE